jgi:hypothetical protein
MVEAQGALDSKSESLLGVVRLYDALKLSKGIAFFVFFWSSCLGRLSLVDCRVSVHNRALQPPFDVSIKTSESQGRLSRYGPTSSAC